MTINEEKTQRQLLGIERWFITGKSSLSWATSMGKGFASFLLIDKLTNKLNREIKVIVVVPTIQLKSQWLENSIKHNIPIEVFVINTLVNRGSKGEIFNCDLLIIDEIHKFSKDKEDIYIRDFVKVFDYVKYNYILGLTATLNSNNKILLDLINEKCPVCDIITIEEAREKSWVSDYLEFNLGLTLTTRDKLKLEALNITFNTAFSWFNRNFEMAMKCLMGKTVWLRDNQVISVKHPPIGINPEFVTKNRQGDYIRRGVMGYYYRENCAAMYAAANNFETSDIQAQAVIWNRAMGNRKKFLYNLECKKEVTLDILDKLKDKSIIFCESIAFADDLSANIENSVCYHSKKTKKEKTVSMAKILSGDFSSIIGVKSLSEGFDYDKLYIAINTSYTSSQTISVQKNGRPIRLLKSGEDKLAIIVNLYVIDSQEEKWLKQSQKGRKNINIVTSVEQILSIISAYKEKKAEIPSNL